MYCLTSPSGKKYVGLTKHSAEARFKKHTKCAFSRVQDCPKLYRAIRKYGKQHFVVETLQSCETLAQAQLAEVVHRSVGCPESGAYCGAYEASETNA